MYISIERHKKDMLYKDCYKLYVLDIDAFLKNIFLLNSIFLTYKNNKFIWVKKGGKNVRKT